MDSSFRQLPPGVTLNALSGKVYDVLAQFTAFPWPIMLTQCKRVGADPARLTREDLTRALPLIVTGVGRFTDPDKAASTEQELTRLLLP